MPERLTDAMRDAAFKASKMTHLQRIASCASDMDILWRAMRKAALEAKDRNG